MGNRWVEWTPVDCFVFLFTLELIKSKPQPSNSGWIGFNPIMSSHEREVRWLLSFLLVGLGFRIQFGTALKVPVRFTDVLPVLPRQVSWPVLNNIHSAVDLLPQYIGSLAPENGTINWNGSCFFDNQARIQLTATGDRGIGGAVIHLSVCDCSHTYYLHWMFTLALHIVFTLLIDF